MERRKQSFEQKPNGKKLISKPAQIFPYAPHIAKRPTIMPMKIYVHKLNHNSFIISHIAGHTHAHMRSFHSLRLQIYLQKYTVTPTEQPR